MQYMRKTNHKNVFQHEHYPFKRPYIGKHTYIQLPIVTRSILRSRRSSKYSNTKRDIYFHYLRLFPPEMVVLQKVSPMIEYFEWNQKLNVVRYD